MKCNINQAKQRILSKWDWQDPKASYPVILWGPPGLGKTHMVVSLVCERMAKELELEFINTAKSLQQESEEYQSLKIELERKLKILNFDDITHELLELIEPHLLMIRLAERPIEQLQGVIVPSLSEEYARFVMPANLKRAKESPWGIVFLDELDKASESKFAAATHILENKIVGDFKLNDGWYVLAAANREEDSFLANPIPAELRNRCANIEVEMDVNIWIDWAFKHKVRGNIIAFHKFTGGKWLARYDLEQTYSFPTPRTWTMYSRIEDRLERNNPVDYKNTESIAKFDNLTRAEMIDFVGKQAQFEYFTYRETYLKFNVEEILSGQKRIPTAKADSDNLSLINEHCVAAFAVAAQVSPNDLGKKDAETHKFIPDQKRVGNLVQFITDLTKEIRTLYLQLIHNTRIINILIDSGQADQLMEEIVEYLV